MEIPVRRSRILFAVVLAGGAIATVQPARTAPGSLTSANLREFFDTYCLTCHDKDIHTAGLALDTLDVTKLGANAQTWEKVIGKLGGTSSPPPGKRRPG